MRPVVIPGTGLSVSRWSFGTGSLHHEFSARRRRRLLDAAADAGFSHFDTSPYYGYGLAETDLGRFARHRREQVTLATKVGLYPRGPAVAGALALWTRKAAERLAGRGVPRVDWRVDQAERSLDDSLSRLQTDYVDLLFLHEPDPARIAADEVLRWLERERARGRIRAWGLAGPHVPGLDWVANHHPLASVLQVKDSLAHREADALLHAGRGLQFTYGYLAAARAAGTTTIDESRLLAAILERNRGGSVVVATRRIERLVRFAEAVDTP